MDISSSDELHINVPTHDMTKRPILLHHKEVWRHNHKSRSLMTIVQRLKLTGHDIRTLQSLLRLVHHVGLFIQKQSHYALHARNSGLFLSIVVPLQSVLQSNVLVTKEVL